MRWRSGLAEHHRRDARLPDRGGEHASAATSPTRCRRGGRNARGDARARRARPTCCCTPSRSSTAPTRRCARRARAGANSSSSCRPFKHGMRLRRRAAADRAVHRDRRAPSSTAKAARRASTASCKPLGETRPAWKVLRVLGTCSACRASISTPSKQVRDDAAPARATLSARLAQCATTAPIARRRRHRAPAALERVADVPIYFADPIVRRSPPLQKTADAQRAAGAHARARWSSSWASPTATQVKVTPGRGEAVLAAAVDAGVPADVVRIAAAHPSTARARARMFGADHGREGA